jgi:hypothetical protein
VETVKTQIRPEVIDDLMEIYVDWREECLWLSAAYERWLSVPVAERELAFAAYGAALDREEQASAVYADHVDRIARGLAAPKKRRWLGLAPEAWSAAS